MKSENNSGFILRYDNIGTLKKGSERTEERRMRNILKKMSDPVTFTGRDGYQRTYAKKQVTYYVETNIARLKRGEELIREDLDNTPPDIADLLEKLTNKTEKP